MPRLVWALFACAWLLRVGFVAYHANIGWQLRYDPSYYLTLAANMQHGVYSLFHPLNIPDTTHMPGYPFLLYLLRGKVLGVLMLQALISTAKVPLVHSIGLRMGLEKRWALMAALLMALEPLDILFAGQVLTESVFATLLLLGLWALIRPASWKHTLLLSACLAACAWLRPNGALMLVAVPALAALLLQWKWRQAAVACALGLLLLSPWVMRQHRVTDRWVLGDGGAVAVAHFHLPGVLQRAGDARASNYREELHARAASTNWEDRASVIAYYASLRADIRHALVQHPIAWGMEQGSKSARILAAPGRGHIRTFFSSNRVLMYGVLALSAVFSIAVVVALGLCAMAWRSVPRHLLMLLLIAGILILTGGLSVADARFKVPAMPMLLLTVAWAAQWLSARRNRAVAALR
ncbi:MAG: hypothetical protein WAT74_16570 [Flavobacteriales bacterium]